jgi:Cupin-like domain
VPNYRDPPAVETLRKVSAQFRDSDTIVPLLRLAADRVAKDLAPSALQVLNADPTTLRQCFGHVPIALRHGLASSGLFTIDRLTAAAEKMLATGRAGRLAIFDGPQAAGDVFSKMKRRKSTAAAVPQLARLHCWVTFININEVDRELDDVYRSTLQDVERLLGAPILKDISSGHMTVLMASPHVITPYHIDPGHNFLCQIANEKVVWLWDPDDRANISESEIERFYCGDMEAARYGVHSQRRGREFHISPGDALYHPPLAPHWVKNGPNVSISVSMSFNTTALDRRARVYQANRILRSVGVDAPPPGRSRFLDDLRSGAISGMKRLKSSFRVVRGLLTRSTTGLKTAGSYRPTRS